MLINLADLSGYNVKNKGKWLVEMLNVTGRIGETEAGRSLKLIGVFNQKTLNLARFKITSICIYGRKLKIASLFYEYASTCIEDFYAISTKSFCRNQ